MKHKNKPVKFILILIIIGIILFLIFLWNYKIKIVNVNTTNGIKILEELKNIEKKDYQEQYKQYIVNDIEVYYEYEIVNLNDISYGNIYIDKEQHLNIQDKYNKKQETIKKIQEKLPEVQYFIQMNSETEINEKNVGMNYLIEQGKQIVGQGDNSFININVDPDEFKVLIFTSGTTSNSKGVMLCNRNLAENINDVLAYVNLTSEDRLMSILPLHHTYESTIGFLLPFAVGASISVCQGLKYIVSNLQETKPTSLLTVPLLIENLYKKINANIQKSKKENLVNSMIHLTNALKVVGVDIKKKVFKEIYDNLGGRIKYIVSAAAPIDAKIGKWLEDIGIIFLQGYGLTETAPIAALTPEFDTKVGSAGKAVIGAELKIDNPNENGEGEI